VARREFLSFRRAQALDLSRLLTLGLARDDDRFSVDDAALSGLAAALDRLGDADRELLLLSAGSGLDSEAVAGALGISAAALRQRLARARRRLGQLMSELERAPQRALPKEAR
jgi:DNA-directed RNA polymerase specialized sigma24 family protein